MHILHGVTKDSMYSWKARTQAMGAQGPKEISGNCDDAFDIFALVGPLFERLLYDKISLRPSKFYAR